jgi:hypothetical protein
MQRWARRSCECYQPTPNTYQPTPKITS